MKEIIVKENEAGQRLDKLLSKYLDKAPKSFLYKMLRKKNITLNGKKAKGMEQTVKDDVIRIFLSEETYARFSDGKSRQAAANSLEKERIVYEDRHILLYNKPAGVLSQKAKPEDISVNEMLIAYLLKKGEITEEELRTFRPSVCNRLDMCTSGMVIAGKTLAGLQVMSEVLKARTIHKYYYCLVSGCLSQRRRIEGYLIKDEQKNTVTVLENQIPGAKPVITEYTPLQQKNDTTFLEVLLITGRSHQIRAHLKSIGHPIIGDAKYGDGQINRFYSGKYGIGSQLLHCGKIVMPQMEGKLAYLSGRTFMAQLPKEFIKAGKGCGYGNMEFQRT